MVDISVLRQSRNRILGSLHDADLGILSPALSRTELKLHQQLHDSGHPLESVYFVDTGIVSLLTISSAGAFQVETAMIGSEGMCGMEAFHQVTVAADRAIVQAPGFAYSMSAASLASAADESATLRRGLHRFAFALYSLAANASACNRRHTAGQRMARWLLIAHDRLDADALPLTHLYLAQMLGVRRSTVTVVAEELRAAGAIDYVRGKITIRDRERLQQLSCDCYAAITRRFAAADVRTLRNGDGAVTQQPT
jgi:CRP-like cAMP-binding protein